MKLVFRITALALSALVILVGAGALMYQAHGIWEGLGAVAATALLLANVVDEVLGLGVWMGRRQAERERPDPEELVRSMKEQLRSQGLVFGGDEHDEEREARIAEHMKEVANSITDPDMKEFAFHFAHIASDCPGAEKHAERLSELVPYIDARLRASTVNPQNDADRPQVH